MWSNLVLSAMYHLHCFSLIEATYGQKWSWKLVDDQIRSTWGMDSNDAVLKLKSNESELAKKKCTFLDYFFFNRSLKLVHLHLFWPRLQYNYEARFTMLTYLCIRCSQSFTPEHYFIGGLSERYINRKVTKEFLRRVTGRINYI